LPSLHSPNVVCGFVTKWAFICEKWNFEKSGTHFGNKNQKNLVWAICIATFDHFALSKSPLAPLESQSDYSNEKGLFIHEKFGPMQQIVRPA